MKHRGVHEPVTGMNRPARVPNAAQRTNGKRPVPRRRNRVVRQELTAVWQWLWKYNTENR